MCEEPFPGQRQCDETADGRADDGCARTQYCSDGVAIVGMVGAGNVGRVGGVCFCSVVHCSPDSCKKNPHSADRHLSRFAPFKKIITGNCSWNSNLASDTESLASL